MSSSHILSKVTGENPKSINSQSPFSIIDLAKAMNAPLFFLSSTISIDSGLNL